MKTKISSALAKEEDGTIQLTFNLPCEIIEKVKKEVAGEFGKNMAIPGFRKGKAPLDKVISQIPRTTLIEKTLGKILPTAFGGAVAEYKLKPLIYPKFELISTKERENWQVRAVTCELPEIVLEDYKRVIRGALATKSINASPARQKEQLVIKTLLETSRLNVPKVLIEEEVNVRLAGLLEKIEKLGLSLETYLSSIGKTPETIRTEYEQEAKNSLVLELALNKIADELGIKVKEDEIDSAIKASSADPKLAEKLNTQEQRRIIRSVLTRRAALDSLTSLL